jgi:membrane fusion protein, heavy metal efflux system
VSVRIRAENADGELKPNAFVEVTFRPRETGPIVLVDEDAVVTDGDRSAVFVLKDSRRFEKREVQPGRRRGGLAELRSGLAAGTRYAAKGALLLLNQVDLAD